MTGGLRSNNSGSSWNKGHILIQDTLTHVISITNIEVVIYSHFINGKVRLLEVEQPVF